MPFLVSLLLFVVAFSLSAILAKGAKPERATIDEFKFPQFEEGTPVSMGFGDYWDEGWFVPFYGDLRTKKIKKGKK